MLLARLKETLMFEKFIIRYMKEFVDKIVFIRDYIKIKLDGVLNGRSKNRKL